MSTAQAVHSAPSSFISPKLVSLINNPQSVSTALAQSPHASVKDVAEKLYGSMHHASAPHSLSQDEEKEGDKVSTVDKMLDKLHLRKAHEGSTHDKDDKNPAADQWDAMRVLNPQEIEQVASLGKFGSKPGELFTNVRRRQKRGAAYV